MGGHSTIPDIELVPSARLQRDSIDSMEKLVNYVVEEQDGSEELCKGGMTDESGEIEVECLFGTWDRELT